MLMSRCGAQRRQAAVHMPRARRQEYTRLQWDDPHLMLAGLKAGATPFRTSRHQLSVMPVTRSGWPVADIICKRHGGESHALAEKPCQLALTDHRSSMILCPNSRRHQLRKTALAML